MAEGEAQNTTPLPTAEPAELIAAPEMLADWRATARVHANAHFGAADELERLHRRLGGASAVFATLVGTTIFVALQQAVDNPVARVALGLLSITAAVLAGLQTFLDGSQRARKHLLAYAGYDEVARDIDVLFFDAMTRKEWVKTLKELSERLTKIRAAAPPPPHAFILAMEIAEEKQTPVHPVHQVAVPAGAVKPPARAAVLAQARREPTVEEKRKIAERRKRLEEKKRRLERAKALSDAGDRSGASGGSRVALRRDRNHAGDTRVDHETLIFQRLEEQIAAFERHGDATTDEAPSASALHD